MDFKSRESYNIQVESIHYNGKANVEKTQFLECDYSVNVKPVSPYLANILYSFDKIIYNTSEKNQPIEWTFARSIKMPNYIFNASGAKAQKSLRNPFNYKQIISNFRLLKDVQKQLPKLPTTYQFYMLYYDIMSFDIFASNIISVSTDKDADVFKLPKLSNLRCRIGMSMYRKDSIFYNGDFFAEYIGSKKKNGLLADTFAYYCINSKVFVADTKKNGYQKNGISNYWGNISIQNESGRFICGQMFEDYFARVYNNKTLTSKFVKYLRKVDVTYQGGVTNK